VIPASEYRLALDQVDKLTQRRQSITATYLSVNAALTAAIAFLFKDANLPTVTAQISVLALLFAGAVACSLWRRLIKHYSALTGWWYEQIRSLENRLSESSKLFTKEYQDLYFKVKGKKDTRITPYEIALTWLFTAIYIISSLAILVMIILKLV
jgi:hypothetical protein